MNPEALSRADKTRSLLERINNLAANPARRDTSQVLATRPTGGYPDQVERWRPLVAKHFQPEDVDKALWVMWWESGGDSAIGGDRNTLGIPVAHGLFQVQDNTRFPGRPTREQLINPEANIQWAANAVYGGSGWTPWGEGVAHNGQPFGALGAHPYPGAVATPETSEGGQALDDAPIFLPPRAGPVGIFGDPAGAPRPRGSFFPPSMQELNQLSAFQRWRYQLIQDQQDRVRELNDGFNEAAGLQEELRAQYTGSSSLLGLRNKTPDDAIRTTARNNTAKILNFNTPFDAIQTPQGRRAFEHTFEEEYLRLKGEFDSQWQATTEHINRWAIVLKQEQFILALYAQLPNGIVSGKVQSIDDVELQMEEYAAANGITPQPFSPEVRANLEEIFLEYGKNIVPKGSDATQADVRKSTIELISAAPPTRRVAIGSISSEVIRQALTQIGRAQLPEGLTEEGLRDIYQSRNLLDPGIRAIIDDASDQWDDTIAQLVEKDEAFERIRLGVDSPDFDQKLTLWQHVKNFAVTPAAAGLDAITAYDEAFGAPFVGNALVVFDFINSGGGLVNATDLASPEMKQNFGVNNWTAMGQAYRESVPWYLQLPASIFLDPTSYLGFGLLGKVGGATARTLGLSEKAVSRASLFGKAIDDGWNAAVLLPIRPYVAVLKAPLFTVGQLANRTVVDLSKLGLTVLRRRYGSLRGITTRQLQETVNEATQAYLRDPTQAHSNPLAEFGRAVIRGVSKAIDESEVIQFWERTKGRLPSGIDAPNINVDAERLLANVEKGGLPAFTKPTPYMIDVARANGINLADNATVTDLVNALRTQSSEGNIMFYGQGGELSGRLGEGIFLSPTAEDAWAFAVADAHRLGRDIPPKVYPVRVKLGGVGTPDDVSGISIQRGSMKVVDADLVEVLGLGTVEALVPSRSQLAALQQTIDLMMGSSKNGVISVGHASNQVGNILGLPHSAEPEIAKWLSTRLNGDATRALGLLTHPDPTRAFSRFVDNVRDIQLSNYASGVYASGKLQGLTIGLTSNIDLITRLVGAQWLNTHMVRPWATAFLKFLNFLPMNVLETGFRAGGLFGPGKNQVDVIIQNHGDLANTPFEFIIGIRGRSEFAMELPKPGTTALKNERSFLNVLSRQPGIRHTIDLADSLNRYQQNIRAAWLNREVSRELELLAPEQVASVRRLVGDIANELDNLRTLNPKARSSLEDRLFHAVLQGPEAVERLKVPIERLDLDQTMAVVQDIMDRHPEIEPLYRNTIMRELTRSNGTRWSDIGSNLDSGVLGEVWQLAQDSHIARTGLARGRLRELTEQITREAQPNLTEEEVFELMRAMSDITQSVQDSIQSVRSTTTVRARELSNLAERDALHAASHNSVTSYLDGVEDDFQQIFQVARSNVEGNRIFSVERQRQLINLIDNDQRQITALLEVRRQVAELAQTSITDVRTARGRIDWDSFYEKQGAIWDHYNRNILSLRRQYNALAGDLPSVGTLPTIEGDITAEHVAALFSANTSDLSRGLVEAMTIMPRDRWIATIQGKADALAAKVGKQAEDVGFTPNGLGMVYDGLIREMGVDPANLSALQPLKVSLEGIRQELQHVRLGRGIHPSDYDNYTAVIDRVAQGAKDQGIGPDMPVTTTGGRSTNLQGAREEAMDRARTSYETTFVDYSNDNIVDALGKAIFPFWTYESQRWPYVYRLLAGHPGIGRAWSSFMSETDGGYTPIPFTDLAVNPLRGTVLMGGMRGLIQKFPEYYDNPASRVVGPVLDGMGRFGFFPGLPAQIVQRAVGAGDIDLPPIAGSPLNLAVWQGIPGAKALQDVIFPDKFREYNAVQIASKLSQERQLDYSGTDIFRKVQNNIELTPEEANIWTQANRKASGYQFLFEQTGLFKLDIPQKKIAREESQEAIFQLTGITIEEQQEIQRQGKRISDVITLPPDVQRIIFDLEKFRYWSGLQAPLFPKGLQALEIKRSQFWTEVRIVQDKSKVDGFEDANILSREEMERRFVASTLSASDYLSQLSTSKSHVAARMAAIKEQQYFQGIPITLEERKDYAEEHGTSVPVENPWNELSAMYYELTPQKDPVTGQVDWLAYFAAVDTLIEAMPEPYQGRFLEFIHNDWTETEKLYWSVNREYLRPYSNLREAVIQTFSAEEQLIIRRFPRLDTEEQQALREMPGIADPTRQLIANFEDDLSSARRNFRQMSPETDAWLFFWGSTNQTLSPAAAQLFADLQARYRS